MKCKKCNEPVLIDGTGIAPSSLTGGAQVAPAEEVQLPPATALHWSVSSPSGEQGHTSLKELTDRYLAGELEPGTLVRAPGHTTWKPPYDQPEIAASGFPAEKPASSRSVEQLLETREKSISFSDETKALTADEVASLKLASQTSHEIPQPFDEKTPEIAHVDREVTQGEKRSNSFFEDSDVEEAMGLFSNVFSEPPPGSTGADAVKPPAKSPSQPTAPKAPAAFASRPQPAPAKAPSAPPAIGATRSAPPRPPSAMPTDAPLPSVAPAPFPGAPAPSSSRPNAAPFPGAPAPRAPSSGPPKPPQPPTSAPPLEVPKGVSFDAPVPLSAGDLSALGSFASPPTGFEAPPAKKKSAAGTLVLVLLVLIVAAGAAVYFLKRELLKPLGIASSEGTAVTTQALSPSRPLDTEDATRALAVVSEHLGHCLEPGGPTGAGRVNVLFGANGFAKTAQVSAPFTHTSVGNCIVAAYSQVQVSAFSGADVIVQTTFTLR